MSTLRAIHDQLDEYFRQSQVRESGGAIVSHATNLQHTTLLPCNLESPFSSLTVVDVTLDHQDIDAVVSQRKSQLSALALQITDLDNAIRKLVIIRAKLEQTSAHLRQSLLAHQVVASPARSRIPPEVLGEVFFHCLPKTLYTTPRDGHSPLVLTRVCRHWRSVATSTPRLWSSLTIHLQKTVCEAYRRGCEGWLARAKTVPFALRVLNDISTFSADSPLPSSILHWLRPLMAQCSDLWWHGPSLPTIFLPRTGASINLPLERLRITSHRDTPSIPYPGSTKRLRSVSLLCLGHDLRSLSGINLPWDNLVELDMHFALFSSTLFVQLLTRCGQLHSLAVSCLCADYGQLGVLREISPGSITHPCLRRIEIKVARAGLDLIFGALTLPALEGLDVCHCCRDRDAWPHIPFMDMVRRSRCTLKRLTVRSDKSVVPHFEEYMEAMPGLAVFTCAPDPLSR